MPIEHVRHIGNRRCQLGKIITDANMISEKLGDNESETKKRKLLMEYEQNIWKKINLNLEKMEDTETKLKIFPILGDEYFRSVETEKMYIGKVNKKKETSRLIKELSSHWPLAGRSHLKRVRWTQQKVTVPNDVMEDINRGAFKMNMFCK
ncbi:hypothetical protein TNCV_3945881 [Trichonephila clavipes]|nr:hypothetical protein TNCV_3945881 [Trichonephila clavipes]